ncbi:MAG: phytanoyl-CoA dioxygenase family protein [Pseudomonadales bacterium]
MERLAKTLAGNYREQGYAILPGFLSTPQVEALRESIAPIHQQWRKCNQSALAGGALNMHSLTHPQYFSTCDNTRLQLFELLLPKALTEICDHAFNAAFYFHNSQLFFNPSDERQIPYWHRDLQFSQVSEQQQIQAQADMLSLHIRIALIEETGIALIPGTHRRWDTREERAARYGDHSVNCPVLPGEQLITLQAGDVLLFDAQMIHRGHYSAQHQRLALDLCVGTKHALTAGFLDKTVLPSTDELSLLANPRWYQRALAV